MKQNSRLMPKMKRLRKKKMTLKRELTRKRRKRQRMMQPQLKQQKKMLIDYDELGIHFHYFATA